MIAFWRLAGMLGLVVGSVLFAIFWAKFIIYLGVAGLTSIVAILVPVAAFATVLWFVIEKLLRRFDKPRTPRRAIDAE